MVKIPIRISATCLVSVKGNNASLTLLSSKKIFILIKIMKMRCAKDDCSEIIKTDTKKIPPVNRRDFKV
jgi:hypothetical protein